MLKRSVIRVCITAVLCALFLAIFRVRFDPVFALPGAVEVAAPEQEARFEGCVAARDREIHRRTFATIDNPDVQREVLATQKEQAVRECRRQYPQQLIRVKRPFRFRLIEVSRRF